MNAPRWRDRFAAYLDSSPKWVADWRQARRWWSMRWSFAGFLAAVGQSAAFAASALPFGELLGHLALSIAVAAMFLGSMISRLRAQNIPKCDDEH